MNRLRLGGTLAVVLLALLSCGPAEDRDGEGAGGSTGAGGAGGSSQTCPSADGDGFFSDCGECLDTTNCDNINGRQACGCSTSADCPCGFTCGSHDLGGGITVGGICVR